MGVDLDLFCEALAVDTVIWSGSLDQEAVKKIFSVIKNTLSARIVFNIYFCPPDFRFLVESQLGRSCSRLPLNIIFPPSVRRFNQKHATITVKTSSRA